MANDERLSSVMQSFFGEVKKLAVEEKTKILAALKVAATAVVVRGQQAVRELADGTLIHHFDVTLGHLVEAVPTFLRDDAKQLARRLDAEVQARGPNWAKEGAHLAVQELLTAPLDAHLNPPPAPATAATVESAVASAVATAVPIAVAAHLAANPPAPSPAAG